MPDYLKQLVAAWHEGKPRGIYSVCSAHPWVLEAAMEQAIADWSVRLNLYQLPNRRTWSLVELVQ